MQTSPRTFYANLASDGVVDAVGTTKAQQIATQGAAISAKHAAWTAVPGNVAAAEIEYKKIMDELKQRIQVIENEGVKVKLGPLP